MLKLYNSLTKCKENFVPINPGQINLYVCGITVYDYCHLGHARAMVCFDVITRYLRSCNYKVKYVRNITDIDDKIIKRAHELGDSIERLTAKYIKAMHEDEKALQNLSPDAEPRATQNINNIINLITRLLEKQYAYLTPAGDVCYEVAKFKDYGKLSRKEPAHLIAGSRVEVSDDKRSPLDFVLWKKAKIDEPSWPSPWGLGRPGWHIECSAMAISELGENFDIHGGGIDLQFPHHENEIAQSEAACDKTFANYWLHIGMLQINNEKMAKSVGNFFTIRDVIKKYHPEVVRYFLLSNHYRSPLNYSEENLLNAGRALARFYQALKDIRPLLIPGADAISSRSQNGFIEIHETDKDMQWVERFNLAMQDDFNTPIALSILFDLSHEVNKTKSTILATTLKYLASMLGILKDIPERFLQNWLVDLEISKDKIQELIEQRSQARTSKNWQLADKIRQDLLRLGVELEDTPSGTNWRISTGD